MESDENFVVRVRSVARRPPMSGPPTIKLQPAPVTEPAAPHVPASKDAFPGGRTGSIVALGAAATLLVAHATVALAGGPSAVSTAIWWMLGIGVVAVAAARAVLSDSERPI
jgi:hypothetical protein